MAKAKSGPMSVLWKRGYRGASKLDAKVAYRELEKIRKANGGELTRHSVRDAARDTKNPLHVLICWDKNRNADEMELIQAARIIRAIEVIPASAPQHRVRQYPLVPGKFDKRIQTFQDMEESMKDPIARSSMLEEALASLLAIRRKYHALQELAIVFRSIDEYLETSRP